MSESADLDVAVLGGGGHVGLPLSLAFARAGLRVGIYDTNEATLERIRDGHMPFREAGADQLLCELLPTGRLDLGADAAMIERTRQLVVVIGTPVDEFLGPSMTVFERAVEEIAPHLQSGTLVVLRSTVYPGTTAFVAQELSARGASVDVAFCPERIAEGHALEELHSLPQIIGQPASHIRRESASAARPVAITAVTASAATISASTVRSFGRIWASVSCSRQASGNGCGRVRSTGCQDSIAPTMTWSAVTTIWPL